jgi:uracil-DNA glycosylase family 4
MINQRLSEVYSQMQNCEDCELSKLSVNKIKPWGKFGNKKILIVSQNPSFYRKKFENISYFNGYTVYGGLNIIMDTKLLDDVYITNLIKCSFEFNKVPYNVDEIIKKCSKWLKKEIEIIHPRKIICLGNLACKYFNVSPKNRIFIFPKIEVVGFEHPSYVSRFERNVIEEYISRIIAEIQ